MKLLLQSVFDEDADYYFRKNAYFALCRASGKEWEDIPSEFARLEFTPGSKDLDPDVMNFSKDRSA